MMDVGVFAVRFGAILGHFKHRTLQCSFAKTITSHVWCGVQGAIRLVFELNIFSRCHGQLLVYY